VTILPLGATCNLTQPTPENIYSGILDLVITGGTPPYTVTWSPGGNGQTLFNQGPGIYTATVTDLWKDFTAVTTCVLEKPLTCGFDISVTEVPQPTSTPTPTPTPTKTEGAKPVRLTPTPTNTPTLTKTSKGALPTNTPTPSHTHTSTPTPTPTQTLTPTVSNPACWCYSARNIAGGTGFANGQYQNCNGVTRNIHLNPGQITMGICSNGVFTGDNGNIEWEITGPCDATCVPAT
jgi:hypothetical protein